MMSTCHKDGSKASWFVTTTSCRERRRNRDWGIAVPPMVLRHLVQLIPDYILTLSVKRQYLNIYNQLVSNFLCVVNWCWLLLLSKKRILGLIVKSSSLTSLCFSFIFPHSRLDKIVIPDDYTHSDNAISIGFFPD